MSMLTLCFSKVKYVNDIKKWSNAGSYQEGSYCLSYADHLLSKVEKRRNELIKSEYKQFAEEYHKYASWHDVDALRDLLKRVRAYIDKMRIQASNKQWDNLRCNIARKINLYSEAYE